MKDKELKKISETEAAEKFEQLKVELMKLNSQVSTGTVIKNPHQIKKIKKTIARMRTYKKLKQNE